MRRRGRRPSFRTLPLASDGYPREKVYGGDLEPPEIELVLQEISAGLEDDILLICTES